MYRFYSLPKKPPIYYLNLKIQWLIPKNFSFLSTLSLIEVRTSRVNNITIEQNICFDSMTIQLKLQTWNLKFIFSITGKGQFMYHGCFLEKWKILWQTIRVKKKTDIITRIIHADLVIFIIHKYEYHTFAPFKHFKSMFVWQIFWTD